MVKNQCHICNYMFANKSTYNMHIKTSKCINKNDRRNFLCTFCNKKYSSNQMLKYHKTICTNKKIEDIKNFYENKILDIYKNTSNS